MPRKSSLSQQKNVNIAVPTAPRIAMCPACDWKTKVESETVDGITYFFVICRDCRLSQNRRKYTSEEDAIAAWNKSCSGLGVK